MSAVLDRPFSLLDVERLMEKPGASIAAVEEAAARLPDEDLVPLGYHSFLMNLLCLFGEEWPQEKVRAQARAAALAKMTRGWAYHRWLNALPAETPPPALESLPVREIAGSLDGGNGLVMLTCHIGHYRHIPSDICHEGFTAMLPLATDAYGEYASARAEGPDAPLWQKLRIVNVEERTGAVQLAKVLAGGGTIMGALDGNTGIDGPRGQDRRLQVSVRGTAVKVKDGLVRLAARYGAPVLVVFALTIDGRHVCCPMPLFTPRGRLKGSDADGFVEDTLKATYRHFGEIIEDHAWEWGAADLFHQWRVPEPHRTLDPASASERLISELDKGGRLLRDARRIVELADPDGVLWTDARTLKGIRLPRRATSIVNRLNTDGIDREWLSSLDESARGEALQLVSQLFARGAVSEASRTATPSA